MPMISVARLERDGQLKGSAWLISHEYALTAFHCIKKMKSATRLELAFYNKQKIPVIVCEQYQELDIAVLKFVGNVPELTDLILDLSPYIMKNIEVTAIGHASAEANHYPMGTPFQGVVRSLNIPLRGKPSPIFAQLGNIDPDPGNIDNAKGLSGGPVLLRDRPSIAIGLVIEGGHLGGIIDIIPIAEIAKQSTIVAQLLSKPVITLETDTSANILWSAEFEPNQASILWEQNNYSKIISISESINNSTELMYALLRLAAHSNIEALYVNNTALWKKQFDRYFPETKITVIERSNTANHETFEHPAQQSVIESEQLALELHSTMNQWLLTQLDAELMEYLENNKAFQDGKIHYQLKDEMSDLWAQWKSELENNVKLLNCFLVRLNSHSESKELTGKSQINLGQLSNIDEYCYPIIFALALSAAGITIYPSDLSDSPGNIETLNKKPGHACGAFKAGGIKWSRVITLHTWTVPFVILPALEEPYFPLLKNYRSMNKTSSNINMDDSGIPPLIIAGDSRFLIALEQGKTAIQNYYENRKREREQLINNIKFDDRILT